MDESYFAFRHAETSFISTLTSDVSFYNEVQKNQYLDNLSENAEKYGKSLCLLVELAKNSWVRICTSTYLLFSAEFIVNLACPYSVFGPRSIVQTEKLVKQVCDRNYSKIPLIFSLAGFLLV